MRLSVCNEYVMNEKGNVVAECFDHENAHKVILQHNAAIAEIEKQIPKTAKVLDGNFLGLIRTICGNCENYVNEGFAYCPYCGSKLDWKK